MSNNWMTTAEAVKIIRKRKENKTMTTEERITPDYASLVIAPLWKFYEVAKHALAEMEAFSPDNRRIDRAYVENRKQHLRAEITEFEQRFPNYGRSDDDQQGRV